MDMNQRQIALSLLEGLREDLIYAHLNNGSRILDVADLRQYIYEQMGRIRTNAFLMDGLYGQGDRPWARHQQEQWPQWEIATTGKSLARAAGRPILRWIERHLDDKCGRVRKDAPRAIVPAKPQRKIGPPALRMSAANHAEGNAAWLVGLAHGAAELPS